MNPTGVPQQLTLVTTRTAPASPAFALKGAMFSLMVLYLKSADVVCIEQQLAARLAQTPNFFSNTPLVLDFEGVAGVMLKPDLRRLVKSLRSHGLFAVCVRHASSEQEAAALAEGLGILPVSAEAAKAPVSDEPHASAMFSDDDTVKAAPASPAETPVTAGKQDKPVQRHSLLVDKSVRGGQQIYAPGGDLIVLGAVNAGAEVLADGNIHVYGPLRGRALAGVKGDLHARVFCNGMEAELLSIAGIYRVSEETLPDSLRGKAVQIYLDAERLIIEAL